MAADPDTGPWVRAGLLDPDDAHADERRALLEYLSARGATIEQMVERHRQGSLPAVASDLVTLRQGRLIPVSEVATRSGMSLELVLRVLVASGLPVEPDSMVPEESLELVTVFKMAAELMGDDAILAFTRVLGGAAIQIAEAAVALFYSELGPGTPREGEDELTRAKIGEVATMTFTEVPKILTQMVMNQFERAQRRAVTVRGWAHDNDTDTEVVALGFVDLVGSTAWGEGLDLREQSLALARFESAAWSSAVLRGGRIVKMIGDEVFFAATSAEAACRIGTDAIRAAAVDDVLPPARGAVGIGLATPREGDYFGPLVNLLSRLVKAGAPGQLVATEPTVAALSPKHWVIEPLDVDDLRGIDHPVGASVVTPASG